MPTELKGEALLDYYREAVRACLGDDKAEASLLLHNRGWYRIAVPRRYSDGSVARLTARNLPSHRAARVREMADVLLRRAKEATR